MCNRCNCNSNSSYNRCGCNRCGCNRCGCQRNGGCANMNNSCNLASDEYMWEAEQIACQVEARRQRENQCARNFTQCMRNVDCYR